MFINRGNVFRVICARLTLFKPVQGGEGVLLGVEAENSHLCHLGILVRHQSRGGTFLVHAFLIFPLPLALGDGAVAAGWTQRPTTTAVNVFLANPVSAYPCARPAWDRRGGLNIQI